MLEIHNQNIYLKGWALEVKLNQDNLYITVCLNMSKSEDNEARLYKEQNQQLQNWIDALGKNKASPRSTLEEQVQTLSFSYKNAQDKILNLEKQLYYESIHNEKQRSIIEILKSIINDHLDDQSILTYLSNMQEESIQEYDKKYEIKSDLQEIKKMVVGKRTHCRKSESLKDGAINDLKKQLKNCNRIKNELMEDLDSTLNEKGALEGTVDTLKKEIHNVLKINEALNKELSLMKTVNENVVKEKDQLKEDINELKTELARQMEKSKECSRKIKQILKIDDDTIALGGLLKKLGDKLEKYRTFGKQMAQKVQKLSARQHLIAVMKLFLSEQALKVYEQFEKTNQQCLIKELQSLSRLERKKLEQLQYCQEEIWRLKVKLLKEDENWTTSRRISRTPHSSNKENCSINTLKAGRQVSEFCSPNQTHILSSEKLNKL